MKRNGRTLAVLLIAAFLIVALSVLWPAATLAQCPLCRAGLQNGGEQTARTINSAIIVLLIPPVAIFCSIFGVAYRKIKKDDEDNDR